MVAEEREKRKNQLKKVHKSTESGIKASPFTGPKVDRNLFT